MANKKFIVKNGLTTQNISFVDNVSNVSNTITATMLDSDTLSFSGDSGQLFSITDSQTGTIFAVNDISGVPSIEVDDDGTIRLAETFGNILIGTDVDDGNNKLQVSGNVSLNTSFQRSVVFANTLTDYSAAAGELFWNPDDRTLDLETGGTTLQLGQEQYYLVKNQTGNTIPNGQAVMAAGTLGASGRILATPSISNGSFPSEYFMGIATENIENGGDGFITSFGVVREIDTGMFSEGDVLYVDPLVAGGLSNTAPSAPNNIITAAIVINSSNTAGSIFVRPTFHGKLQNLEDVVINGIQDGDGLQWSSANSRFEVGAIDADTLDSLNSTQFLRSDAADTKTSGDLGFSDSVKATFGTGNDLQIYHDGSHSYIDDAGTGSLFIRATNLNLQSADGSDTYLTAAVNGAVGIRYDGSEKLVTTSTGVGVTGDIAVSGTVDGRDVASDGSKLDGIEAGATGDQTASEILTAIKTVDGSASGLDADLLDGQQGSYYLDWTNTTNKPDPTLTLAGDATGSATFTNLGNATLTVTVADDSHNHIISNVDGLQTALDGKLSTSGKAADSNLLDGLDLHTARNNEVNKVVRTDGSGYIQAGWINTTSGATTNTLDRIYASNDGYIRYVTPATLISQLGLWTSGNDGSGSGLDADLLDGQQGSYYTNASNLNAGTVPTARLGSGTANSTTYLAGDQTWKEITSGGGTTWAVKTSNYTAVTGDGIIADTSGGTFTVTLPSSPSAGDNVIIADGGDWGSTNLTVGRNGSTIEGAAENLTLDIGSIQVHLIYSGTTWQVYAFTGPAVDVDDIYYRTVSENLLLASNKQYRIVSSSNVTLTLPETPATGDTIGFQEQSINDNGIIITIARNGNTIEGIADDITIDTPYIEFQVWYDGTTWRLY